MKRTSSDTAGCRADGASVAAHPSPERASPLAADVGQPPGGQILRDGESDRQGGTADPLHLFEHSGVALGSGIAKPRNMVATSPSTLPDGPSVHLL